MITGNIFRETSSSCGCDCESTSSDYLPLPKIADPVTFENIKTDSIDIVIPTLPGHANSMNLQRSSDGGETWTTIATNVSGTYTSSGLTVSTEYCYRVVAVGTYGSTNGVSCCASTVAHIYHLAITLSLSGTETEAFDCGGGPGGFITTSATSTASGNIGINGTINGSGVISITCPLGETPTEPFTYDVSLLLWDEDTGNYQLGAILQSNDTLVSLCLCSGQTDAISHIFTSFDMQLNEIVGTWTFDEVDVNNEIHYILTVIITQV